MKFLSLFVIPVLLMAAVIPLNTNSWTVIDWQGKKTYHPSALGVGALYIDLPSASTGKFVDYMLYRTTTTMQLSGTVTMTFKVMTTGWPTFGHNSEPCNTCAAPATLRPYFETGGPGEFDRWWANPVSYTFADGKLQTTDVTGAMIAQPYSMPLNSTVTISVPLRPEMWSSVYGKVGTFDASSQAGFKQAAGNVYGIGLSFGGGCFFGHGVNVSGGTAQFQLTSLGVS